MMALSKDLLAFVRVHDGYSLSTYTALKTYVENNEAFPYFHLLTVDSLEANLDFKDHIRDIIGEDAHREVCFTDEVSIGKIMLSRTPDNEHMIKLTLLGLISKYDLFEDEGKSDDIDR